MGDSKILEYIEKAVKKGYTKEEIRKELVKLGYDSEYFEKYLLNHKREKTKKTLVISSLILILFLLAGSYFMISDKNRKIKAYAIKGEELYAQGNLDLAIVEFQKVLELQPESSRAHVNIGHAYLLKAERSDNPADYYNLAITEFSKGMMLNPNYVLPYKGLGRSYYKLENYDLAIQNFKKALELDPNSFVEHSDIGWAYAIKGEHGLAHEHFKKAIELNPDYNLAHEGLGYLYYKEKKFDLAIQEIETGRRLREDSDSISLKVGITLVSCYMNTGKDDLAEKELEELMKRYPNNGFVYVTLGELYFRQGKYELSLEQFKKALEINPDSQKAKEGYEKVLSKLG